MPDPVYIYIYMEKTWWLLHKNAVSCIEQVLEATPHKTAAVPLYTTHHEKSSKLDKPDMRNTAGEVRTMYSCGPLHMDEQSLDDHLKPIYSSLVLIWDVAWKICYRAIDDRDMWPERVKEICASSMTS